MRRRLDLAAALVVSPQVLFVDEPTTGLDPQGRREVWSAIRDLVSGGTTVLLTTQYLEEADQLADRIIVLRAGRVVAEGTPDELKAAIGGDWLDVSVADPGDLPRLRELAAPFAAGELQIDENAAQVSIPVTDRTRALVGLSAALAEQRIEPLDITVRRPTLDEVFLQLTGTDAPPSTDRRSAHDDHHRTIDRIDPTPCAQRLRPRRRLDDHPAAVLALARPAGRAAGRAAVPGARHADVRGPVRRRDRRSGHRYAGNYYAFLMPGIFTMAMLFGLESTMTAVNADAAKGVTDRFRSLPISPAAVVLGRCIADMINSVAGLAVLVVAGLLLGWSWKTACPPRWPPSACCCCCGSRCSGSASSSGCWPVARRRSAPCRSWSGRSACCPTCSSTRRRCPAGWARSRRWNPLSATASATRELFGNPGWNDGSWLAENAVLLAVGWPVVITAVFAPLAIRAYRRLGG